ncbi:IS110 family transposase [Halococcus sp. AFM35]|uniref:IS110 family transposase n=1 Tax=Halococcus sp. AFM35 TaxID=3421653 RepID=UPI003EBA0FF0
MYLGIDVHKRESQVAVRNEDGEIVREVRVENANLDEIAQQYAGSEAAIEATGNYYTIHDTLDEYLDVSVANPAELKLIANSDRKTDRVDAIELARLVRLGSIPESYVPPEEIRECRALVRGRKSFVEDRTEYVNKIHGLLDQQGITRKVKPLSVEGREFLDGLSLEAPWETLLETYLETIDAFTERIASLEEEIEDRAASLSETQLLMTIPGVSSYSALLIYAELGEIERFDGSKQAVSFAGLNPVIRESGDSRFEGGISKTGSGDLRWILVQSAHTAVHKSHDEYLSRFYDRLQKRMSSKEAIVATARKLLVSIYHMLDRKEVYNPPGVSA